VFAQTLFLRCGRFEVAWDDLCLGLDGYTSSGVRNELRNPGAQTIPHLNCLREHRLNGWPVSPGHVLETVRDLTVTEPRDKMYAAMSTTNATAPRIASNTTGHEDPMQCLDGISPPEGVRFSNTPRFQHPSIEPRTEWIAIDYRKTCEQACIDTAEALNLARWRRNIYPHGCRIGGLHTKFVVLIPRKSPFGLVMTGMANRHMLKTVSSWFSKAALCIKWIKLRVLYSLVAGTTSITRVAPILSSSGNGWSELTRVQKLNTRDKLIGNVALLSRYEFDRI